MNNKILSLFLLVSMGFLFNACEEEFVDVLEGAEGVYPPAISTIIDADGNELPQILDFVDINAATAGFTVGVDEKEPRDIQSMVISARYLYTRVVDGVATPMEEGPQQVTTINSFPTDFTTTATEMAGLFGKSPDFLELGDRFVLSYRISTPDAGYESAYFTTVAVSCPSALGGTYSVSSDGQSTDGCCPDPAVGVTTDVTVTDDGNGNYTISDITGGLWLHWYNVYGITGGVPGKFNDVCNNLTIFGTSEPFGSAISGTGSVDPESGVITIEWLADSWGDVGTMTLTPQ